MEGQPWSLLCDRDRTEGMAGAGPGQAWKILPQRVQALPREWNPQGGFWGSVTGTGVPWVSPGVPPSSADWGSCVCPLRGAGCPAGLPHSAAAQSVMGIRNQTGCLPSLLY